MYSQLFGDSGRGSEQESTGGMGRGRNEQLCNCVAALCSAAPLNTALCRRQSSEEQPREEAGSFFESFGLFSAKFG